MDIKERTEIWLSISMSVYATAAAAALGSLITMFVTLPASDGAKGEPFILVMAHPLLLMMMFLAIVLGGSLALPIALWLLQSTRLQQSIPFVAFVVIGSATASGPLTFPISVAITFIAGLIAMTWAHFFMTLK